MRKVEHWTDEEIEILKANYETLGCNIPALKHKNLDAIRYKARRLNLKHLPTQATIWTDEEIEILKAKYEEFGVNIKELKHKSKRTIYYKASALNLRNPFRWKKSEIEILKEKYPKYGVNIPELLTTKTESSIRAKACDMKIKFCGNDGLEEALMGKTALMNCNLKATITKVIGMTNLTVTFENGEIKEHVSYQNFESGKILPPSYNGIPTYGRIGESKMMNCGLTATIIKYKNANNITLKFENGEIAYNKTYGSFASGEVRPPSYYEKHKNKVGERKLMNYGMYATIIEYHNSKNMTVKFDNGEIKKHAQYPSFAEGRLRYPSYMEDLKKRYIGQRRMMNCGIIAEITECCNYTNITVKFDSGEIRKNVSYEAFRYGQIIPSKSWKSNFYGYKLNRYPAFKEGDKAYYIATDLETGEKDIMTPYDMMERRNTKSEQIETMD